MKKKVFLTCMLLCINSTYCDPIYQQNSTEKQDPNYFESFKQKVEPPACSINAATVVSEALMSIPLLWRQNSEAKKIHLTIFDNINEIREYMELLTKRVDSLYDAVKDMHIESNMKANKYGLKVHRYGPLDVNGLSDNGSILQYSHKDGNDDIRSEISGKGYTKSLFSHDSTTSDIGNILK